MKTYKPTFKEKVEDFKYSFERIKTYPLTKEGIIKMELDKKTDKIGNYFSMGFYGIMFVLLVQGAIGQQFITSYIVGTITSKTVKYLMR